VIDGKLYVLGGFGVGGNAPGLVYEYDPATNTWSNRSPMPTTRNHPFSGAVNRKIYAAGGELQNDRLHASFRALEAYEPATNRWIILPSMPAALHGNAVAFIGNRLHTVSGKPEGGWLPDLAGKGTAAHDVLEIPAGFGTN
jgi:N-acetylneuraminic acid mutarotase